MRCGGSLRDVRPSVIEVEPDTALARQYPGGDEIGPLGALVVTVLTVCMPFSASDARRIRMYSLDGRSFEASGHPIPCFT